jgi:hypothetical protein
MSTLVTRTAKLGRSLRGAAMALVLATIAAGVATRPALADDDGWHRGHEHGWERHGWERHEWREHEWREHRPYVYASPGYVYEPPPAVVYAPPVVYAPAYVPAPVAPSLSFVFPLGR